MSRQTLFTIAIISSLPCCGGSVPTPSESTNDLKGFEVAGQMTEERYGHFSTLLQDGRVLTAGGAATDGSSHRSAEIFDPETGTSSATGNMSNARMDDKGTLLPDGRVVFASANQHSGDRTYPVEIFDPRTDRFTAVPAIPAFEKVSISTLLPSGKILAFGRFGVIAIIIPETGEFVYKNRLLVSRGAYTATMLRDGRVLITGGQNSEGTYKYSEIYDPSSNVLTKIGSLMHERFGHLAMLLPDGSVLIVGGRKGNPASSEPVNGAERFDPTTKAFSRAGSPGSEQIREAAVLPKGVVFFILRSGDVVLYDAANGTFYPTGDSLGPDYELYTVTLLRDGRVLVIGGMKDGEATDQILVYRP